MPPQSSEQPRSDGSGQRTPAIHTMKSDAEELLKTQKPSLIKIAAEAHRPPEVYGQPVRRFPRVIIPVIAILLIAGVGTAGYFFVRAYWYYIVPAPSTTPLPSDINRVAPPPPYFATETSRTITVKTTDRAQFARLMADTWNEKERTGTMKQIIIKVQDGPVQRFATLADFFDLWRIEPPKELTDLAGSDLMVFIYSSSTGNRLGLAVHMSQSDRAFAAMLRWEPSLLAQSTPLFFDERVTSVLTPFEDRSWRNIGWRYLKVAADRDIGIGYLIFPAGSTFVFTTSKETTEAVINRLFEAR